MIALCREHADKADNGAFTDAQLREMKRTGKERAQLVRGRFDWMRRDLLTVVGGNYFYDLTNVLAIGSRQCIGFSRDEDGYLLLNFSMPTLAGRHRAQIVDNFWSVVPDVSEVICPPSGRLVEVRYDNGDRFRVEFFTMDSAAELQGRYTSPRVGTWAASLPYPLTVVEVWETAAGTSIEFGPDFTKLGGLNIADSFARGVDSAFKVDVSDEQLAQLFPTEV
jgi:hypothetical protein